METSKIEIEERLNLRRWTRKSLLESDYEFAISKQKDRWQALIHSLWRTDREAAQRFVCRMLDHELTREFACVTAAAFLDIPENRAFLDKLGRILPRKPAEIEPLQEVELPEVLQREDECRRFDSGARVKAFIIERDDPPALTLQRFKNWLAGHNLYADAPEWVKDNRAKVRRGGRKGYVAMLEAIAVRRLKKAGLKRWEAEQKLQLDRYFLSESDSRGTPLRGHWDRWGRLPLRAEREIERCANSEAFRVVHQIR